MVKKFPRNVATLSYFVIIYSLSMMPLISDISSGAACVDADLNCKTFCIFDPVYIWG